MRELLNQQKGESIISVMMAAAIGVIVMMVMTDTIVNQAKQTQGLQRSLEASQVKMTLMQTLNPNRQVTNGAGGTDNLCGCLLDPTKNAAQIDQLRLAKGGLNAASETNPVTLDVKKIPRDCEKDAAGNLKNSMIDVSRGSQQMGRLKIESVKFEIVEPVADVTVATSVRGRWVVGFEQQGDNVSLPPAMIDQYVTLQPLVDAANPEKMIVKQCLSSNPNAADNTLGNCPAQMNKDNMLEAGIACLDGREGSLRNSTWLYPKLSSGSGHGAVALVGGGLSLETQPIVRLKKNSSKKIEVYLYNRPSSRSGLTITGDSVERRLCTLDPETWSCGGTLPYNVTFPRFSVDTTFNFSVGVTREGAKLNLGCSNYPGSGDMCINNSLDTSSVWNK